MISEKQLQSKGNNFTMVRLLLSMAVVFSHSFDLSAGHGGADPLFGWLGQSSLSYLAVNGFFFLSGFLVTGSFVRLPSVPLFAAARAARILPGYAVSLLLTTVVLGLFVSRLSALAYFQMIDSWAYVARNVIPIRMQGTLPGVFESNPYPLAVNGSLWTIPFEMFCYAALCVFGALGFLAKRKMFFVGLVIFALLEIIWWTVGYRFAAEHGFSERIGFLFRLSLNFGLGVAAYQYRDRVVVSWRYCAVFAVLILFYLVVGWRSALVDEALRAVFTGYLVLCLSFATSRSVTKHIDNYDISFGLYIYAFPVQQLLFFIDPAMRPVSNMMLTYLITTPLAFLSWIIVERPALSSVKRLRRQEPSGEVVVATATGAVGE